MSKVSVIVPVYNVEKYLEKCLKSVVNQTLEDIEIILVNDGSTDGSMKIVNKYVKKYPKKIKLLEQENQGVSDARNNGVKLATSKYIMFVDNDDFINKDMVEKMYNKISAEQADIVICGNNVVDEKGNLVDKTYPWKYQNSKFNEQFVFSNMCVWNKIYTKDLIIKNNLKFRSRVWYEDLDYSFKAVAVAKKVCFLEENLYNYLLRNTSIMHNNNIKKNSDLFLTFDEIIDYTKKKKIFEKYKDEIEFLCIQHMYLSAIVRVSIMNVDKRTKKQTIDKFVNYVETNFNDFNKNKYLKTLSLRKKIIFNLVKFRQFWLIKLIFMIKR